MATKPLSPIPYVLAIIILVAVGYYGYTNYGELKTAKDGITAHLAANAALEKELATTEEVYSEFEQEAQVNAQKRTNELALIFPGQEEITNLTREFDTFFSKNNFSNSPLFLSNLTYGAPINDEAWDYTILPVKMTIQSSETNFYKTLDYIENSGSFQNQLRLMAIKAININFTETPSTQEQAATKLIDYTVDVNAYFKKQIEKK